MFFFLFDNNNIFERDFTLNLGEKKKTKPWTSVCCLLIEKIYLTLFVFQYVTLKEKTAVFSSKIYY